jgi:undecaprenyl-phosphate 4-deoxy-4-formamido-L-arabinose transferase
MEKVSESLSIVFPIYNEKHSVKNAVLECLNILSKDFVNYEIILVDDGSTDGTDEIIAELSSQYPQIIPIFNYVNLNQGISIQKGFKVARNEYVIHNAIDLPLAINRISSLIASAKKCDLLVIERKQYEGYRAWRLITSVINRSLRGILFPRISRRIHDMNFTQIYKRNIIKRIMPLAKSPAFTTPEMIYRAIMNGLIVDSVKTEYLPRSIGKGAFGKPHDILWSLYDMLRFRIKSLNGKNIRSSNK